MMNPKKYRFEILEFEGVRVAYIASYLGDKAASQIGTYFLNGVLRDERS